MSANIGFGHAADFTNPMSILALVFIGLAVLFIYLYNSLSMRRSQLDRQMVLIRMIVMRRSELAAELVPGLPPVPSGLSLAELLRRDEETAATVNRLENPDPEKRGEYRKLAEKLADSLESGRAALEQYNRIVEHPEARRVMKFFRFAPRERF